MNVKEYIQTLTKRAGASKAGISIKKQAQAEKDIELYREYFGIGVSRYPTFQSVGIHYGISRQRVEQKVKRNLMPFIRSREKAALKKIEAEITARKFIRWKDLLKQLRHSGIVLDHVHLQGLANLIRIAGIKRKWEIYTLQMEKAKIVNHLSDDDFFIIAKDKIKPVWQIYKQIKTAPGLRGFADLNNLSFSEEVFPRALMERILLNHPEVWVHRKDGHFWYIFENRDNVLMNSLEKMSYVVQSPEVKRVAEILHSTMKRRGIKNRADVKVAEAYLRHSKFVTVKGNVLIFKDNMNRPTISFSDQVVIDYFAKSKKMEVSGRDLFQYFYTKGFTQANAIKNCYHSPFLYIDKSQGRGNYVFHFILKFGAKARKIDKRTLARQELQERKGRKRK